MRYVLPALLAIGTLATLSGGVVLLLKEGSPGGGIEVLLPTPTASAPAPLRVHVSGEVRSPGVYQVWEGARVSDVVELAGGPTDEADLAAVNLALKVRDEQHWHIPKLGEETPAATGSAAPAGGKLDLNSATAQELMRLPGIKEVRAAAIVRYREANGPFARVDDLLAVSGIGTAVLEGIRELVEVRPVAPP